MQAGSFVLLWHTGAYISFSSVEAEGDIGGTKGATAKRKEAQGFRRSGSQSGEGESGEGERGEGERGEEEDEVRS